MPIISENPKELYEALYNELKNKYGPVSVYLRDKDMLDQQEKAVGKAMEDFIKQYQHCNRKWKDNSNVSKLYAINLGRNLHFKPKCLGWRFLLKINTEYN